MVFGLWFFLRDMPRGPVIIYDVCMFIIQLHFVEYK